MKNTGIYVTIFMVGLAIGYMKEEMIHDALVKSHRMKRKMKRSASHVMNQMMDMME